MPWHVALIFLLLSAGSAAAQNIVVSPPSPIPRGQQLSISGKTCPAGTPAFALFDSEPALPTTLASDQKTVLVQTETLGQKRYTLKVRCGDAKSTDISNEVPVEVTSATQPGTQIASVQKVICAQNLNPKDKIDDVDVKGKRCAEVPAWPVRMGDDIAVHVTGYRNEKDLRLFVEGIELPNLQLQYQGTDKDTKDDVFRTTLGFDDSTSGRESWVRVLRMARDSDKWQGKVLDVSIGPHGGPQWPTTDAKIQLNLYPVGFVSFAGPLLLVLLLLLLYLGKSTNLLRDGTGAAVPPYSLAKHQMAVWFFVVVAAYLFVTATTGGTAATSSTALMLIGISGATGLASVVIDQNKRTAALADGQALKDSQALQALIDERDDLVKTLDARNTDGLRQQLTRAADGRMKQNRFRHRFRRRKRASRK